jgi:hypothetical protein
MIPEAVAWVDPGGMTGLAVLWGHGQRFHADEFAFMEAGDAIEIACAQWGPRLAIGWETYTIRPHLPQTDAHTAIGMIAITRRYAIMHRCQILPGAHPNERKTVTMAMLKAVGWWVPAKDDAQSAAQHLLAWLKRSGQLPPRERAILSELSVH